VRGYWIRALTAQCSGCLANQPDKLTHHAGACSAASRVHAAVVHHETGKVYIIDLGSTRGTQVDSLQLEKHRPLGLKDGFRVRFGGEHAAWVYTVRIDSRGGCVHTRVHNWKRRTFSPPWN